MSKHGPGPWSILFFSKPERLCDAAILDADQCTVATLPKWADEYREELKANGEFIIRACNAYDDLLAAMHNMVLAFEDLPPEFIANWTDRVDAVSKARAAIAKAEGSTP